MYDTNNYSLMDNLGKNRTIISGKEEKKLNKTSSINNFKHHTK